MIEGLIFMVTRQNAIGASKGTLSAWLKVDRGLLEMRLLTWTQLGGKRHEQAWMGARVSRAMERSRTSWTWTDVADEAVRMAYWG